jgi:pimeloyl-ACP methyl ester carboxylesterase
VTDSPSTEIRHRTVSTNGIEMHVAEAGEGAPVVLCHGFPELWYSWRHQLPALAAAGYHAMAPDQRGYGGTTAPAAVEDYDILHLSDDILGLLDANGYDRAVVVGHDWGAPVVWHLAQRVPERVAGVVGLSVPCMPRGPMPPTELMKALFGDNFFYILYFQEPGVADAELGADPQRSLRAFYWTISGDSPEGAFQMRPAAGTGMLDVLTDTDVQPAWFTDADLAVYTEAFTRTGFTGGLNWYRNFDRNWRLTEFLGERKVEVPAFFIAGQRDPVILGAPPEMMETTVADLRGTVLIPGVGHWTQQEAPGQVNAALVGFLREIGW